MEDDSRTGVFCLPELHFDLTFHLLSQSHTLPCVASLIWFSRLYKPSHCFTFKLVLWNSSGVAFPANHDQ